MTKPDKSDRAEGVAALQQAGEPECWRVKEGWGDWSKFWHDRQNAERLESKGWTIQALYAHPLPQQTALVEQGVEKIIGPHEPAACGASAPSEPPRSDGEDLFPLLASAWFYGGWKAETHGERKMQSVMERAGWWPIESEAALIAKIDGGES